MSRSTGKLRSVAPVLAANRQVLDRASARRLRSAVVKEPRAVLARIMDTSRNVYELDPEIRE